MRWTRAPALTRRHAAGAAVDVLARRARALLRRARRRRRRRAASAAVRRASSDLPRQAFEDVIDGVAMDLDTHAVRDVRRSVRVLPPRRVGRRPDLHRDLRLPERGGARVRAEPRRRAAAHEHPPRRQGRPRTRPRVPAARGSRGATAARSRISRPAQSTEPVRALLAFECRRAREFYARAAPSAPPADDRRRLVAAEIMRAVYFETLRRIERSGLRRVHRRASACRARGRR